MLNPEAWLCIGLLATLALRLGLRLRRQGLAMFDFMTIEMMLVALVTLVWPEIFPPPGPPAAMWAMGGWCLECVRLVLLAWVGER